MIEKLLPLKLDGFSNPLSQVLIYLSISASYTSNSCLAVLWNKSPSHVFYNFHYFASLTKVLSGMHSFSLSLKSMNSTPIAWTLFISWKLPLDFNAGKNDYFFVIFVNLNYSANRYCFIISSLSLSFAFFICWYSYFLYCKCSRYILNLFLESII